MADTHLDGSSPGSKASLPWLGSVAARIVAGARHAVAVRRSRRLLQALPDSVLKDIGISRGNIDYIVVREADAQP